MHAELTHHLGYEKHDRGGKSSGNSRSGMHGINAVPLQQPGSKPPEQKLATPREPILIQNTF